MQVDELKTDGTGDAGKNGGDNARVQFAPEQQAKVQELIDNAFKKAYSKAQKSVGTSDEVERLKVEVDKLKEERKMNALLRAVTRHNVVAADEVTELLRGKIKVEEDGTLSVSGDSGGVMINSLGAPISVDEYVGLWLRERPHHLRPSGLAGAGSHPARSAGGSSRGYNTADPVSWRNMPREDLDRLLKEGVKVQGAAGQTYTFKDVKNPFLDARRHKAPGRG
ncbi:MAG: hypothetical protein A3J24_08305 [Deltaproteobacteria bacterium RIFCSPLOWO2_02_FULL_53_8]|nr:MAG: hypothetical protein A3J24_08305 [Deltaproteobacteria bacterium RIFCSPLOWO2_02_FULL_53_8]